MTNGRNIITKDTGVSIGLALIAVGAIWYLTSIQFQLESMNEKLEQVVDRLDGNVSKREFKNVWREFQLLNPTISTPEFDW